MDSGFPLPDHRSQRTGNPMTVTFDRALFARMLRARRGSMSLREAEEQSGVSAMTISRYEREKFVPDLVTFGMICDWLKVPTDEFFKKV